MDFEWNPFLQEQINLIQLCTSKCCLIIQYTEYSEVIEKFLETHLFCMKDIRNDQKMLVKTFGKDLCVNIIDVAVSILGKYHLSQNFDQMVTRFAPNKPTGVFKNKKISLAPWDQKISVPMMLYACYDVIGLQRCLPGLRKFLHENQDEFSLSH